MFFEYWAFNGKFTNQKKKILLIASFWQTLFNSTNAWVSKNVKNLFKSRTLYQNKILEFKISSTLNS